MRRGDVWWANMPHPWGRRPVLLLSRNEAYPFVTWILVAPLTTRVRGIPSEVEVLPRRDGVPQSSAINLDNLQAIRRESLDTLIVHLTANRMDEVDLALHFALGLRH
jgi:mRNA interferase MazF